MEVMVVLVTFELGLTLILEGTELRLTDSVTCPRSYIHLPSDNAWAQTCFPGPQASAPPTPSTHRCLGSRPVGVQPFGP